MSASEVLKLMKDKEVEYVDLRFTDPRGKLQHLTMDATIVDNEMLSDGVFFDTLRQGLWVAILVSLPILSVALVVGLVIGLFQALTSIQEMTLTFVPKLMAIVVVFWMSMSFMTETLVGFFQGRIIPMITGG